MGKHNEYTDMTKKENTQTQNVITLDDIYKAFGKQKKHSNMLFWNIMSKP
jgi:hypothetical protein